MRILIYLFPAVIDLAAGVLFIVPPVRIARMGYSFTASAAITAIWGLLYISTNSVLAQVVNERNAWKWMLSGCVTIATTSVLFIVIPGVPAMYVLSALIGIGSAQFFAPFQVFMKQVDLGGKRSLSFSTGMYTFSWSMGFSAGPFLAGWVMGTGPRIGPFQEPTGWRWCFWAAAAGAFMVGLLILAVRHWAQSPERTEEHVGVFPADPQYRKLPDLAWLGWIGAGTMLVAIDLLRGIFPKAGISFGLDEQMVSWTMFLIGFIQGLTALCLCKTSRWMYQGVRVALFALSGVVGLALFITVQTAPMFLLASIFMGVYTGGFFFYFVFHSLTHPTKAPRYVSVNEAVVGGMGVSVPLAGGLAADWMGFDFPVTIVLALVIIVTIFQVAVHRRFEYSGLIPGK